MCTLTTAWERDAGEQRAKLTATPAPASVAGPDDEPTLQTLTEERDRLARRVDVLSTRVALLVERERRAGARLVEAELRAARAEELVVREQELLRVSAELVAREQELLRAAEQLAAERLEHIAAIHRTLSWRITAPLRRLSALLRG
jgi:hypothetical protein